MRRRGAIPIAGVALAAVFALSSWWPVHDHVAEVAGNEVSDKLRLSAADPSASLDSRKAPAPASATAVALLTPALATTVFAVPMTMVSPQQRLRVGEMNDLIVGLVDNTGIAEVSFTVQFDPNVLQARHGTPGAWVDAAGSSARFVAEVSDSGDRVQVRSGVPGQRAASAGGGVAVVQFQGIAQGTTSIVITDVTAKDRSGRSLLAAVAGSNLQMTVDAVSAPQAEALREGNVPAEPRGPIAEDGD